MSDNGKNQAKEEVVLGEDGQPLSKQQLRKLRKKQEADAKKAAKKAAKAKTAAKASEKAETKDDEDDVDPTVRVILSVYASNLLFFLPYRVSGN